MPADRIAAAVRPRFRRDRAAAGRRRRSVVAHPRALRCRRAPLQRHLRERAARQLRFRRCRHRHAGPTIASWAMSRPSIISRQIGAHQARRPHRLAGAVRRPLHRRPRLQARLPPRQEDQHRRSRHPHLSQARRRLRGVRRSRPRAGLRRRARHPAADRVERARRRPRRRAAAPARHRDGARSSAHRHRPPQPAHRRLLSRRRL